MSNDPDRDVRRAAEGALKKTGEWTLGLGKPRKTTE
jgi:hypothetical protein